MRRMTYGEIVREAGIYSAGDGVGIGAGLSELAASLEPPAGRLAAGGGIREWIGHRTAGEVPPVTQ